MEPFNFKPNLKSPEKEEFVLTDAELKAIDQIYFPGGAVVSGLRTSIEVYNLTKDSVFIERIKNEIERLKLGIEKVKKNLPALKNNQFKPEVRALFVPLSNCLPQLEELLKRAELFIGDHTIINENELFGLITEKITPYMQEVENNKAYQAQREIRRGQKREQIK